MLLRHTTKEYKERSALTINPMKTCQPIGALYAGLGIHNCLPHSHGSQGCCAYHRSMLSRHYKEPVMAGTSSFTEGSSVFGGQSNMLQAINNIFSIYNPDVIAVHTTCLSETIGDDLVQIIKKAYDDGKVPKGKIVFHANTPSYTGSHVTGYSNMVTAMVKSVSETTNNKVNQINIIPGYVEPSDMREIKRLLEAMGIKYVMFPDTSGVLDGPLTGKFNMFPRGGVTIDKLRTTGDSFATVGLGKTVSSAPAKLLDSKCKVPFSLEELPIGLNATDRFINTVREVAGVSVPESINEERGQVIDFMSDAQQYFYHKKVAIAGDPDHVISMVEFCQSLDMIVTHVVTGTPGKAIEKRLEELIPEANFKVGKGGDLFTLHQWMKSEPVDLLIGNTHCKYIARDEDVPFVRFGFPIVDRIGHQYFPVVGYKGSLRLLEQMLNAILDRKDRDDPDEEVELVL